MKTRASHEASHEARIARNRLSERRRSDPTRSSGEAKSLENGVDLGFCGLTNRTEERRWLHTVQERGRWCRRPPSGPEADDRTNYGSIEAATSKIDSRRPGEEGGEEMW